MVLAELRGPFVPARETQPRGFVALPSSAVEPGKSSFLVPAAVVLGLFFLQRRFRLI